MPLARPGRPWFGWWLALVFAISDFDLCNKPSPVFYPSNVRIICFCGAKLIG